MTERGWGRRQVVRLGRMSPDVTPDRFPLDLSLLSHHHPRLCLFLEMWATLFLLDWGLYTKGGPVQWEARQGEWQDGFAISSRARSGLCSSFLCADDFSTTSHRFVTNIAHHRHSSSLACKCETEHVCPAGVQLLLAAIFRGYAGFYRRVSPAARLFNHTCRFCVFTPLPRLQVWVGGRSPNARSLTPTWCLFRGREGLNIPLLRYFHPMGCPFNQTSRFSLWRCLLRGIMAVWRGWMSRVSNSYSL